jgi:hypothetical protein
MQPTTTKLARHVGSFIPPSQFQQLVDGFASKHPTEQRSVLIAKELICSVLAESPQVCGIRFMYGLSDDNDPCSWTVILMPCVEKDHGNFVPNLLLTADGYSDHTGVRLSADSCWEILDRHVSRMCALLPGDARRDMPRGCFFGIMMLEELVGQADCEGVRFHFGYNPSTTFLADRYESVLEAADEAGMGLGIYLEDGTRCPPICPPPFLPLTARSVGSYVANEDFDHLISEH